MNLGDSRLERPIEQINRAGAEKLEPLPIISWHSAGGAAEGVLNKGHATIGRALRRDITDNEAGVGQSRRRIGILSSFAVEANRDIHVAATIAAYGTITWSRRSTRSSSEFVRLPAILRVTHEWIIVRVGTAVDRRPQIEVPEIGPARNPANSGDVAVAKLIATHARLDVLANIGRPRRIVRAKGHATLDICSSTGDGDRYRYASPTLSPDGVVPTAR